MVKVYIVMVKSDGCPATVECIKKSKISATKFADKYAKTWEMELCYAKTPEEFYANDGTVMTVFSKELED